MTSRRKTPTLTEFKQFAADVAPAARAVLMARVHEGMERERVASYINPIFATYHFTIATRFQRVEERTDHRITHPKDLYLSDEEALLTKYFAECDAAHRAHGFTGPQGHCPHLTAEVLRMQTERALIDLAAPLFGITDVYGEDRTKYLELLIGAALKAEAEAA